MLAGIPEFFPIDPDIYIIVLTRKALMDEIMDSHHPWDASVFQPEWYFMTQSMIKIDMMLHQVFPDSTAPPG
jgi:hypothetical protein